tara:strand:+ start:1908 stop:2483 length:576 start_codon:yes stop_codon:yes gene_type:complete
MSLSIPYATVRAVSGLFIVPILVMLFLTAAAARADTALSDYLLGPGDRINIQVFGHEDLSSKAAVGANGAIALPLIGQVKASGLTVSELEELVISRLDEDFVVDPKVAIEVVVYRPFFILGEVNKPGKYDYVVGLSMRKAVAMAEGFTRRGKEEPVLVIREDRSGEAMKFEAGLDSLVFPGDTIEIQRRLF